MLKTSEKKHCYVQTYGCQMNEHDSFRMIEILSREGYSVTDEMGHADLVLLNTCSVRENPENKVYSVLGRIRKYKEKNPNLIVGVGGCVAQQEGKKILQRSKCVDMVFGTDQFFKLPEMLAEVGEGKRVLRIKWMPREEKVQNFVPETEIVKGHVDGCKAYVSITKGCDNFCSFCIVPMTRGRLVSREHENILEECKNLIEKGAQEIMLLGQNVNSYQAHDIGFYELLKMVANLEGLKRLRFISPYPNDWTKDLSDLMAEHPVVSNYLHLPYQAGSNRILKMMRRGHTKQEYLDKVAYMRKINPNLELSTDLIVGFPSETEEDFEHTLDVLRKVQFRHIYAYKYSVRPNTRAEHMEDDVLRKVKEDRLARVFVLQDEITKICLERYLNTTQEILIESAHPKLQGVMNGRTDSCCVVSVMNEDLQIGDMVLVKITGVKTYSLEGELLSI